MKLIKPSFEIMMQQPGEVGMLKHIETCGRVAWKSEDRTTEDSYLKFIEMLKGVNHGSVLEHGTVYLYLSPECPINGFKYRDNPYSRYVVIREGEFPSPKLHKYITTNYRVLVENDWLEDLQYACEPMGPHAKRVTVRFVCDRGVSHEFVRHRVFSFTQESTRYCNYTKDKFGNEITYIIPPWLNLSEGYYYENRFEDLRQYLYSKTSLIGVHITEETEPNYLINTTEEEHTLLLILRRISDCYFDLIEGGDIIYGDEEQIELGTEITEFNSWKPQQARAVLPNSLKTELIMTGFVSDWRHFFALRTAKGAHHQASELAIPLQEQFKQLNLIWC